MLIEIFTNGRVLIDGQDQGPTCKAERLLKEYLLHPESFRHKKSKAA
jgi:hypothetical protein